MTRVPYLAVFGGLIVFTVFLSLSRIVPVSDSDANSCSDAASHGLVQGRHDVNADVTDVNQIKKQLVAFIGVQVGHCTL